MGGLGGWGLVAINGTSSIQWESQGKEHYNFERIGEWSGDDRKTMYTLLWEAAIKIFFLDSSVKYSVYRISGAACFIKKEMELQVCSGSRRARSITILREPGSGREMIRKQCTNCQDEFGCSLSL